MAPAMVPEPEHVVSGLPQRMFAMAHPSVTVPDRDQFVIAPDQALRKPAFNLNDEQSLARIQHDEIRVTAADVRFVIDDAVGRKLVAQEFEGALFTGACMVW